jgi:DNA-binding FadR family transcriptional regulator
MLSTNPSTRAGGVTGISFNQIRAPKTAELVADQLRRQIIRGELREGDTLPPESRLLEQFKVSRPTLREAFRVLESEMLITVSRGVKGGARVHTPSESVAARYAALVLEYRGTTLADVQQAAIMIETPCIGLLARNRSDEDLKHLWDAIEETEKLQHDQHQLINGLTNFHSVMIALSGNRTMALTSTMLRNILDAANYERVDAAPTSDAVRQANATGIKAHRRLVELIQARDVENAERLMRKHLMEAGDFLMGKPAETLLRSA